MSMYHSSITLAFGVSALYNPNIAITSPLFDPFPLGAALALALPLAVGLDTLLSLTAFLDTACVDGRDGCSKHA